MFLVEAIVGAVMSLIPDPYPGYVMLGARREGWSGAGICAFLEAAPFRIPTIAQGVELGVAWFWVPDSRWMDARKALAENGFDVH